MIGLEFFAYGAIGGLAVELAELYRAISRVGGLPWKQSDEPSAAALLLSIVIRAMLGGFVSFVLGVSAQISGPIGAFSTGIAAPLIVDQIGRQQSTRKSSTKARNLGQLTKHRLPNAPGSIGSVADVTNTDNVDESREANEPS